MIAKDLIVRLLRASFHRLPLSQYRRSWLKSGAYRLLAPMIKDTASYRHWCDSQAITLLAKDDLNEPVFPPKLISVHDIALPQMASDLDLPSCDDYPDVSILIPVYNQARLTLCCLASIAAHHPQAAIEIIVIDDGSCDETKEIISSIQGIQYVRNETNLGFVGSINRGAKLARGRYLHLLNNDTQVQANWLDALLNVFRVEADAGIVGSKLIYPSGYLQEAGATLKRDGNVELIGLNDNPAREVYNRRRRVDHCSGASILIERTLFNQLGGLDVAYAPAYYEDCDLSLRVLTAGRHVIYEPSSVVVHHLSATTATHAEEKKAQIIANKSIYLSRWQNFLDQMDVVKLIAFYLPQFHPIPENDCWWGKGFTEWTNVTRAKPNFYGHYQPHLPADLGFYDLRLPESRQAQAELARRYGIYGFCYYYYWFGGKQLLQRPLEEVLASGEPDYPFCICWANENWSRRWDGRQDEVLMGQSHSDEDDLNFIRQITPLLRDGRYIRVAERPLLLVYRIDLLPDAARTSAIWRDECLRSGIGEIYLASVQSFGAKADPRLSGFDACVEFPPHERAVLAKHQPRMTNPDFRGVVYDYEDTAENFMRASIPIFPFFRTAMPGWDNTARRQNDSHIFINSTPAVYEAWLAHLIEQTRKFSPHEERFVFINAWNEWAEGNHLEPDQHLGHSYLKASRTALGELIPRGFGDGTQRH